MTDSHKHIEEAVLYVLDQLEPVARRQFENRMAASSELRAMVQELERGTTALTLAAPRRELPPGIWNRIENALEEKQEVIIALRWPQWLRSGWAAAAACLVGWLLTIFYRTSGTAEPRQVPLEHQRASTAVNPRITPDEPKNREVDPSAGANVQAPALSLQAKGQIASLHREVMDLEGKVKQLSTVVTQQQAMLAEPTRLKFFNLQPNSSDGIAGTNAPPPSPAAQRALLLAVARQLGWATTGDSTSSDTHNPGASETPSLQSSNKTMSAQSEQAALPEVDTNAPPRSIPGYASVGTNGNYDVTLAMDASMLPAGVSSLDVWISRDANASSALYFGPWQIDAAGSLLRLDGVSWAAVAPIVPGATNPSPISWVFTNAP